MRTFFVAVSLAIACCAAFAANSTLQLHGSTNRIGAFSKVEFEITGLSNYSDPFDPAVVDLHVEFTAPDGKRLGIPAFFAQEYERRRAGEAGLQRDWAYPAGTGVWKARFAPSIAGEHIAVAVLKDDRGEVRSAPVTFECVASGAKGFIRVARKDSRFFEFDNGEPFFPVGQNLAFIGSQQYVTPSKAEEIFGKFAENGANYLRVWTCAQDWALAIEARKSAWSRSWGGKAQLVPMPDNPARKCLLIASTNATQEVNPSHPVALRPSTRYVMTGRIRTDTNAALRLEVHGTSPAKPLASARPLAWTEFRHEFTTGPRDWWLGQTRLRFEGQGTAWLSDLSLKEGSAPAPGAPSRASLDASEPTGGDPRPDAQGRRWSPGPELLWEADMNRQARGFYNPLDSFLLDELVAAAERRGIYLQLCMLTRDLYMDALKDPASDDYARAIADAKKFFRHAIARWGYSTSVAGWEYWNEMNPNLPTGRFYSEVGEFFEKTDPYRHLRSTSTWGPSAKDCRHAKLDFADVHFYLRPVDKSRLANEVDAVLDRAKWLREQAPGKPVVLGEFGLADDQWRITDGMKRSPDLSDMHNALWASALSGISGTALFWWWERIDQRDGYANYRPLSRFIADVPWNSGDVQPVDAKCSGGSLRVIGVRAGPRVWLWLFDPAAAWAKVAIEKQTPPMRRGLTIELTGAFGSAARAVWSDTRTGAVVLDQTNDAANGVLRLAVPDFQGGLACRIAPR